MQIFLMVAKLELTGMAKVPLYLVSNIDTNFHYKAQISMAFCFVLFCF